VGGTKTLFVLFDKRFRAVDEIKVKTHDSRNSEDFAGVIAESLKILAKKAKRTGLALQGIGIGCAGSLTREGNIKESLNIPFLKGFSFRSVISKEIGTNVTLLNDVDAGLYGEHQLGAAKGRRNIIGIFVGTGIGGALIIDGKLYRGANSTAGNIGHYFVFPAGPRNDFEADSTLNDVASGTAIAGAAATLAARKLAPHLLKLSGTDVQNVTNDILAEAIAKGDQWIEKLVRSRCHILGIILSNLVDFLNPEMIVLGGGLTKAMPAIVRAEVEAGIRAHSTSDATKNLEVVVAKLKDRAVAAGAAKFATQPYNAA